jgi:signal transduction histidine kinase/CheY-like chemotaxis protein
MNYTKKNLFSFAFILVFGMMFSQQDYKNEKAEIKKHIQNAVKEFNKTNYDKALEFSKYALINSFAINDNLSIAQSYNTIGVIYDECAETDKAIEFYHKALRYATNVKNDTLNNWIYGNLGSVYYFNDVDIPKGIAYYKKALKYAEKVKDSSQIIYTKLNLASAYFSIDSMYQGKREIDKIKNGIFKKGSEDSKLSLYILLGIEATHNSKFKLSEEYYANALKIAKENNYYSYIINIYENLAKLYKKNGDLANKRLYEAKIDSLHNIVFSKEKVSKLKSQALHIELDEHRIQLEKIENENIQNQKAIRDSKLVVFLFIIGIVVLLLLLLVLYKNIKFREKANMELKKAYEELIVAKERAEEASLLKSQFVSTITHELRTPLYGVIGITNIILDEHKELSNSPHLKSLKFSAKYLLSLVNDVLQINKIEEKKIVLENLIFNLSDEINTICNSVEYIADKNNNKLIVEIDTEIPEFLIGDKLRLSQIIMNLVSNALKFTKNGKVVISADLKSSKDTIYNIEFKIKDDGVGIPKEHQEKIFEKFVQIERREEDYQGTGLGLSIVSSLIELFDSEIVLESEENVGTTFSFVIGFEYNEEKSKEIINNIEVDLSSNYVYNILVVEDNKINQIVTKKIIQNSNMNCTIVDDGYAALVAIERENFDLILMDINMPLINGFETTKKIREKGIQIPVVALTAFDKQEVSEEAIAAGMNDILIKPFEPIKLYQIISNQVIKNENAG